MEFGRITLAIFLAVKIIAAFDVGSLNSIEEIIKFVAGVVDSVDEEKVKAAGEIVDGFEINGTRNYVKVIRKYFVEFPHLQVSDQEVEKLENLIQTIDDAWMRFRVSEDNVELREFVKLLPEILSQLYSFYVGGGKNVPGYPTRVATDSRPFVCEITENDQLRLRKLHQILILSELRGFILSLKAMSDPQKTAARAIFHSQQFLQASRQGFLNKWNHQHTCDPPENVRGKTFSEFLGLFQGVVLNELQTNSMDGSNCHSNCNFVDYSRIVRCYDADYMGRRVTHCHVKPCNGPLFDCLRMISLKACEMDENSDRRFMWTEDIYTDTSRAFCPGRIVELPVVIFRSIVVCNICRCLCAEQEGNSTAMRTISLIPQLTDIHRNMVMTGVRFAEKDRMFHLQIEQAELGPHGEIIPGTEEWKELGDFQYDSAGVGRFWMKKEGKFVRLKEFVDFSFVALDQRTVNLDELFAEDGQVLIGVRFVFDVTEDAFEVQIKSWPFDPKTGKLAPGNPSDVEWIGWKNAPRRSKNYDYPRKKFNIGETQEPLTATTENMPVSIPNQYLLIRATTFLSDLHQHTIPYLDLQPVTYSSAKIPLSGLEMIYRRAEGFGGFLSFKIFGFDFTSDFRWQMPANEFNKYRPHFDESLILQDSLG